MLTEVSRADLNKALRLLGKVAPRKTDDLTGSVYMESSEGRAFTLCATNGSQTVTVMIDSSVSRLGSAVVRMKDLTAALKGSRGALELQGTGSTLIVGDAQIERLPVTWPMVPASLKGVRKLAIAKADDLRQALERTGYLDDGFSDLEPSHGAVQFLSRYDGNVLQLCAHDMTRYTSAMVRADSAGPISLKIPRIAAEILAKLAAEGEQVHILDADGWALFMIETPGITVFFRTPLLSLSGALHHWLLPRRNLSVAELGRGELLLLAREAKERMRTKMLPMTLTFNTGTSLPVLIQGIETEMVDDDEAKSGKKRNTYVTQEQHGIVCSVQSDYRQMKVNPSYMVDALTHVGSDEIRLRVVDENLLVIEPQDEGDSIHVIATCK